MKILSTKINGFNKIDMKKMTKKIQKKKKILGKSFYFILLIIKNFTSFLLKKFKR